MRSFHERQCQSGASLDEIHIFSYAYIHVGMACDSSGIA